ncbi:uncharacterized protein CCOS01_13175 [Colletotrichum costaricense]|uniref:Uncharacterized protein n=1 Tax=Colletotrichum costaricense TaxID=1209916 RepID=A0AAI9YMG9_9PEZI|nr:uncharacterized protein CCOS01_13175 [Colletotrichum costaricense]KAK1515977.1 hypothetical protein CCOS01_13175 [Colletotrichum costaricense]
MFPGDSIPLLYLTFLLLLYAASKYPEDLTAACNADSTPERCDTPTVRPHESLATEHGLSGPFRLFDVLSRAQEVRGLPASPLDLSVQYVPQGLVEQWAQWTDAAPLSREGPSGRWARICYVCMEGDFSRRDLPLLGILRYEGTHREFRLPACWSTHQPREDPVHL